MKSRAQASAAAPAAHGAIVASFAVTAARARVSAASAYCDAASTVTDDPALFSNRPERSSITNPFAGAVVSPRRSRTVLLYSRCVSRRIAGTASRAEVQVGASARGDAPGAAGAGPFIGDPTRDTAAP